MRPLTRKELMLKAAKMRKQGFTKVYVADRPCRAARKHFHPHVCANCIQKGGDE